MPFNFQSPGAAAGNALRQYLVEQEARKRQAMLDDVVVQRERRLGENADAQAELARETAMSQKAARESTIALNDEKLKDTRASRMSPGTIVSPEMAQGLPEGTVEADKTLAAKTLPMSTAAPDAKNTPGIMLPGMDLPSQATGQQRFKGTDQQRAIEELLNEPGLTDAQRRAVQLAKGTGDFSGLAQLFKDDPSETRNAGGALFEKQSDGTWKQVAVGPSGMNASTKKPYYHRVDQADGVWMINSTDPNDRTRVGDLKPGETAQEEIANGQTIMWMMDNMMRDFTPEKVGPLMGRYKSVEQAITGGDQAFAALAAQTAQLQNVVINLRTGAAMSESEAGRILAELPDPKLPVDTFLARLHNAQNYYQEYLKNRATGAYGRQTTAGIDAMVGGARPDAPKTAPAAAPATTAPGTRKRYNPASGRAE